MGKEYLKRWIKCMLGLALCGTGMYFTVQAVSIGIAGWETFQTGLSMRTGLQFGTCTVIVSFCVIVIDILLRGKIGIGTFCNAVMIGKTVDFWHTFCDFLPQAQSVPVGFLYILIGQTIIAFGYVIYMKPALGCGPGDTLMVELGRRFPKVNIGIVRFCIEICVLLIGVLLGAPFGWGTVFTITCSSYIMQAVFKLRHFRARDVQHEDLRDTYLRLKGRT